MKAEKILSPMTGILLGLTLALGSIGCFASAFDLTLSEPLVFWGSTTGITLLCALVLQWKHGSLAIACLLALLGGFLYRDGTALQQLKQLIFRLSTIYDRAYHWGVVKLVDTAWDAGSADLPLLVWAVLICLATLRSVCLQKRTALPVLTALVPLSACIVVTDTVPREGYLLILLTGLILLILPSAVRRENPFQGLRLTFAAGLPVVIGLTLLFLAIPQDSYVNRSALLQENLITALDYFPQLMDNGITQTAAAIQGKPARQVDLAQLGAKIPFTYPVMDVTTDKTGILYLRGQDFDGYDGLGWTASENRQEPFFFGQGVPGTVAVHTHREMEQRFLPYYPSGETFLAGGYLPNAEKETSYTIKCHFLPANWRLAALGLLAEQTGVTSDPGGQLPEDLAAYLALPETTRQEARQLMADLLSEPAANTEKAERIAAMVIDSAGYDLDPGKIPDGEPDFALWFLKKADKGCCIHFATAAAVLLRAADVPARYVTGYMVEASAGETVTVTEADAHAWAEYYEPQLGCWIPLEATPAGEAETVTSTVPPVQTQPTEAPVPATEPEIPETAADTEPISSAPPALPEVPAPQDPTVGHGLLLLLLIPALIPVLAVQRSVRLKLRRRRQHRGTTNQQALQRWREAERLARLLKETPAEELVELAQKAKYSQHALTAEELQSFDSYCRSCLRRLKEKPLPKRLVYQYFYAAY